MNIAKKTYDKNLKQCLCKIDDLISELHLSSEREAIYEYVASHKEIEAAAQKVLNDYLYTNASLHKDSAPKISLNLAPQASGKSQLNQYAYEKMRRNCVVINSDDIKKYYPRASELSHSKYSVFYSYITDIGSNIITSLLLETALSNGYNIIFEGTGRTSTILNTINPYRNTYRIKVRTIAVAPMTSMTSIMLRYISQKKCNSNSRLVRCKDFMASYNHISSLIDEAEKDGYLIEVFSRGKNETSMPIKLYASNERSGFYDAVNALNYAREYNARISKEENKQKLKELHVYCQECREKESTESFAEFIETLYNIILFQDFSTDTNDF